MNQAQPESPQASENADLENTSFPADEPGLTTTFDKSGEVKFTEDGPQGSPIVPQDEFWDGVKNADQTPREVASSVPTDVAAPEQSPEAERESGK